MTEISQNIKMLPGAVAACALPMFLGLVATFAALISDDYVGRMMILPISLCFLFGTPLAAWLACRHLRGWEDPADVSRWGACFGAAFLGASTVHFMAAVLYVIIVIIVADVASPSDLISFFYLSARIHLCLWIVLTLPFILLCATIFWRVTKFPADGFDA